MSRTLALMIRCSSRASSVMSLLLQQRRDAYAKGLCQLHQRAQDENVPAYLEASHVGS